MNNDLEQFSEETLQGLISGEYFPSTHAAQALARIALSAKQAEPVAWKLTHSDGRTVFESNNRIVELFEIFSGNVVFPLYTTPPANSPVVPEGWINTINGYLDNDGSRGVYDATGARAYRAKLEQLLAAAPEKP